MNTIEIILSVVSGLGITGSGILGYFLHRTTNKRLAVAEADKAEAQANHEEWELEKERLQETHNTIMTLNEIIKSQGETISRNNKALDDKTARLREVQDREAKSNEEKAALAAEVTRLTLEIGELRLRLQKHECIKIHCIDRDPPNEHTYIARAAKRKKNNDHSNTHPNEPDA